MSQANQKPLLTLSIGAYNHERFIRQAIAGAFAQTYSPLQIILSDDCSKDRTFEIMAETAATYRGPHEIVLNRNPKNLGIAGHVNRVVQLTRGELLILSAGDDISLPFRAAAICEAWEGTGRKAFGVHSTVTNIDESFQQHNTAAPATAPANAWKFQEGRANTGSYLRSGTPVVLGCTGAWSRALFDRFGPLPEDVVYEDMALAFRSLISGGLAFVDQPLVQYRLHDTNIHHNAPEYVATWKDLQADEQRIRTGLRRKLAIAGSFLADLEKAKQLNLLPAADHARLAVEVESFRQAHAWELDYREARFLRRLALYLNRPRLEGRAGGATERLVYRLLPNWCYYSTRILKNRLRAKSPKGANGRPECCATTTTP